MNVTLTNKRESVTALITYHYEITLGQVMFVVGLRAESANMIITVMRKSGIIIDNN